MNILLNMNKKVSDVREKFPKLTVSKDYRVIYSSGKELVSSANSVLENFVTNRVKLKVDAI